MNFQHHAIEGEMKLALIVMKNPPFSNIEVTVAYED